MLEVHIAKNDEVVLTSIVRIDPRSYGVDLFRPSRAVRWPGSRLQMHRDEHEVEMVIRGAERECIRNALVVRVVGAIVGEIPGGKIISNLHAVGFVECDPPLRSRSVPVDHISSTSVVCGSDATLSSGGANSTAAALGS